MMDVVCCMSYIHAHNDIHTRTYREREREHNTHTPAPHKHTSHWRAYEGGSPLKQQQETKGVGQQVNAQ